MFLRLVYGLIIVIVLAAAILAADAARFFTQPLGNSQPELIEVAPGTSFQELVSELHRQHIIRQPRDARYLSIYARLNGQATSVKSGEYRVPPRKTPRQLLQLLVSGRIRQHKLTLVEGWRFKQTMRAVNHDDALEHTLRGKTNAQIMAALGHPNQKPEGRFMPDTYMFPRGLSDVAFLRRAYNAMQNFLTRAWKHRADDLAIDKPYQALILASLIEKETAKPSERGRIAGVFNRRLKKGMRLQTDPSVIYGIPDYDGDIHKSDLKRDTPYNTYTRAGLPPTPIASPSRKSIRAALHPASGSAMYFVSRGNGTHVFSDTLAEQQQAIRKYQKGGS